MNLYLTFTLVSLIGMAAKLKQKKDSLADLAAKGNFQFPKPIQFLVDNRKAIIWMLISIAAFQFTFGKLLISNIENAPVGVEPFLWGWVLVSRHDIAVSGTAVTYLTIAYMGQDFLFSGLGRTSKEVRAAIDYKTTIADEKNNTLDNPTPLK